MDSDRDREAESRRIIGRVGAETEASMTRRGRDHPGGRGVDEKDWAELWGTRIGRVLGLVLLAYLVWTLISFVARGG